MTREMKAFLAVVVMAVLLLVMFFGFAWWIYALARGVFAVGPFVALMASIIVAGILSKGDE